MVEPLETADFVIGSRYAPGGSCEYPLSRVLLSRTANSLARTLLGIPVRETTTSYRGFRRGCSSAWTSTRSAPTATRIFVESIYQVSRRTQQAGAQRGMAEFPIRFVDRRAGSTKISKKEIWKGVTTLARLAARRGAGRAARRSPSRGRRRRCPASWTATSAGRPIRSRSIRRRATAPEPPRTAAPAPGTPRTAASFSAWAAGWCSPTPSCRRRRCWRCTRTSRTRPTSRTSTPASRPSSYNLDAIETLPAAGRPAAGGRIVLRHLPRVARERGHDVLGVEPSVWASGYARDTLGVPTVTGGSDATARRDQAVRRRLLVGRAGAPVRSDGELERHQPPASSPGGVFAFSTLDYENWSPRLLGERWPWLMDMHLYYFTSKITKQMLERAGFRLVHQQSYCHIITLDYLLSKLTALGVPGADAVRGRRREDADAQALRPVPFRRHPALRLREGRGGRRARTARALTRRR